MHKRSLNPWLFYVYALEGFVLLVWLLLIPSEGGQFSFARWMLIGAMIFPSIAFLYLGFRAPFPVDKFSRPAYIIVFALLSFTFSAILFLLRYFDPEKLVPIYERLSPLLWYGIILSGQSFFYLQYLYKGFLPLRLRIFKPVYVLAGAIFLLFLGLLVLVAVTRLGLTFDPVYWGEPGVPILWWQFALALVFSAAIAYLAYYVKSPALDLILVVSLYLLAVVLWLGVPMRVLENSFYMPFAGPDNVPYPYSDSSYYDQMAQSLLIGHPYQGVVPIRPLYIAFLTLLHLAFGENYPDILIAQTFVLAMIPIVLYFLGRKLHGHVAGVALALFFIFREYASLLISSATRVTNTRMILVDLPTLFLLLLSCLFAIRWLDKRKSIDAFVAGGTFGLLLLLRTQSFLIFPVILLVALLIFGWRSKDLYRQSAIFILATALALSPWVFQNYQTTKNVTLDTTFQSDFFYSHYTAFGNVDPSEYNFEGMGLGRALLTIAIRDPRHVFGFITNHFLATQINGVLVLPLIESYNGLFEPLNLYWMSWDGHITWYNQILLLAYLVMISLGLSASWKRWRWLGLLPLGYSLGYAISTAVARFSSWRYDFPSDWIFYFYFGIGFAEFIQHSAVLFGADKLVPDSPIDNDRNMENRVLLYGKFFGAALVFAFIGGLPYMLTGLVPPRYTNQEASFLFSEITPLENVPSREDLDVFAAQSSSFYQTGRLLYPRFFYPNDGLVSANPSPAYVSRDYPRYGFYLLNQMSTAVVFPVGSNKAPLPHAEDVIVIGCMRDKYVEARLLIFPELKKTYWGNTADLSCSP